MRPPFKCIVCVCVCVVLIGVAILYSEQRAIQVKRRARGQKTNLLIPTHITCAHTQHTHIHTRVLPYCMYKVGAGIMRREVL